VKKPIGWIVMAGKKPYRKPRRAQWDRPAGSLPGALYESERDAEAQIKRARIVNGRAVAVYL
jgi:hypothetical protein